jgi:hypothetical protein
MINLKYKALGCPFLNQIDLLLKVNKKGGNIRENVLGKGSCVAYTLTKD